MRPDACGICLLKQTASGAQSVTSTSKIKGFRNLEADLSALFHMNLQKKYCKTNDFLNNFEPFCYQTKIKINLVKKYKNK